MRVKQLWEYVPLPSKLKLVYNRLTLSRITTAYFVLALTHCLVQIGLQSHALVIERAQSVVLHDVVRAGNVTEKFAALDSDDYVELCRSIPGQTPDTQPCQIFSGVHHHEHDEQHEQQHIDSRAAGGLAARGPVFTGTLNDEGQIEGVTVTGLAGLPTVTLSKRCTDVLAWPDQIVSQAKREALVMIAFQVWLFGISLVAILNESIPHVLAALATHVLSTGWSSFQIARTIHFWERFTDIVTNVACGGVDLMPTYWHTKTNNQIPILVLNVVSLLVSCFLSWKLCKQYGVQSFNRVGASPRMHRIYLLVLVLSVSLQLTAFFLITALALWIEQLSDGPIAPMARHRTIYLGVFIGTAVLILPWLYMGWTAVRRERRRTMLVFLFTSILLIVAQLGMFISPIYRLTFNTWSFFGALTVAAYILLVASFIMAVVCRACFGRGLAHFLRVQEALDDCDFMPVYFERRESASEDGDKEPLPWDEEKVIVRKLELELRKEREYQRDSVQDISPVQVHTPPRVHFPAGDAVERPPVRFAGDEGRATPPDHVISKSQANRAPSGHKRDHSSGTWYNYPGGRELITRGVNNSSRGQDVGLPRTVRPSKRPPGLSIVIPRAPGTVTYAPGRI